MLSTFSEIATIIGTIISLVSLIITIFISNNVKKMITNSTQCNLHDKNVTQNVNGKKNKTEVNIK